MLLWETQVAQQPWDERILMELVTSRRFRSPMNLAEMMAILTLYYPN